VSLHRKRRFRAAVSFAQPKLRPPLPALVTVEGDHPRDCAREALFNAHPHQTFPQRTMRSSRHAATTKMTNRGLPSFAKRASLPPSAAAWQILVQRCSRALRVHGIREFESIAAALFFPPRRLSRRPFRWHILHL